MLLLNPYLEDVKRYSYLLLLAFIFNSQAGVAQLPSGSNLPIVIINTDGSAPVVDSPRVLATMKIISKGPGLRNYLIDQSNPLYLNYNGRINIEIRGSSSQATEKKQYGFSTLLTDNVSKNNVSLLDMPAENDWIFNGMVWDTAKIRDYITYNLSREIGEYASRTAYCEVIINGDYRGIYLLEEKIKADKNRVNVFKITASDIYQPEVTGGYITKADKDTGGDPVAWWMTQPNGWGVAYIHDLPKPENVTTEQNDYIYSQFNNLANASFNNDMALVGGIPSVIDVPSFIDHMIITELSSNADGYQISTFFHKDRNGKLRAGPLWDNDLTYGNDLFLWGFDRSKWNFWQFHNGDNDGSRFWWDLYNTFLFRCLMSKRWNELIPSEKPLNLVSIDNLIDQTSLNISEAVNREYIRWGIKNNFSFEVSRMKTWLSSRITWMTNTLGSYSGCINMPLPKLVIDKINYHPKATLLYPDADDLEFIEILNNGSGRADLTGVYFAGTGLVYQFPPNTSLAAGSSLFLAGDTVVFREKYGIEAFSKFTRDLSNKSQNIVLADGYGNIIDQVHYYDTLPWPDADGNGSYLKLRDPVLDNNIASSWTAVSDENITDNVLPVNQVFNVYPVPADNYVKIAAFQVIDRLEVFDMQGREIISETVGSTTHEVNVSHLPKGAYVIRITCKAGVFSKGIIKR
jgi:hypothetical protein